MNRPPPASSSRSLFAVAHWCRGLAASLAGRGDTPLDQRPCHALVVLLVIGCCGLLAIFVPLMCLGAKVFDEVQGTYIIYLLSQRPWIYYGAFGTSLVLMIWSLYGVGMRRSGALLMGLAPALHPTMGTWC